MPQTNDILTFLDQVIRLSKFFFQTNSFFLIHNFLDISQKCGWFNIYLKSMNYPHFLYTSITKGTNIICKTTN